MHYVYRDAHMFNLGMAWILHDFAVDIAGDGKKVASQSPMIACYPSLWLLYTRIRFSNRLRRRVNKSRFVLLDIEATSIYLTDSAPFPPKSRTLPLIDDLNLDEMTY